MTRSTHGKHEYDNQSLNPARIFTHDQTYEQLRKDSWITCMANAEKSEKMAKVFPII